ncbi:MAG: hypothetical protein VKJ24_18425 [Synechococcales bacterium]|nr:hypothetical protein [Synechococcales bacterium]
MTDVYAADSYPTPNREWWAQRWIDVLESFGFRQRLARARTYAREGNVLSLSFEGAKVQAKVQGTAPEPYEVNLRLEPFSDEQWGYIVESMAERAIFSAKLLAGEMPNNIEEVFTANGLSLFPFTKFDIHSHCNCPDPVNPCKHIGAVYYLLGDRFSEDPFVLFQLRGRGKTQIIEALRQMRQVDDSPLPTSPTPTVTAPILDLTRFWQYRDSLDSSLMVITPASGETVLDILGNLPLPEPLAAANPILMEQLRSLYSTLSQQAVLQAMATASDSENP